MPLAFRWRDAVEWCSSLAFEAFLDQPLVIETDAAYAIMIMRRRDGDASVALFECAEPIDAAAIRATPGAGYILKEHGVDSRRTTIKGDGQRDDDA